jgi:hypothetical protein
MKWLLILILYEPSGQPYEVKFAATTTEQVCEVSGLAISRFMVSGGGVKAASFRCEEIGQPA